MLFFFREKEKGVRLVQTFLINWQTPKYTSRYYYLVLFYVNTFMLTCWMDHSWS